jgi:hypothetical protein
MEVFIMRKKFYSARTLAHSTCEYKQSPKDVSRDDRLEKVEAYFKRMEKLQTPEGRLMSAIWKYRKDEVLERLNLSKKRKPAGTATL